MMKRCAIVLCVVGMASPVWAQAKRPAPPSFGVSAPARQTPPVNPTTAEFTPSPDHTATSQGGPVITSYVLDIYPQGSTTPVATRDIGKPTPVGNLITFTALQSMLAPVPPGTYTAKVTAVGPGGTAASLPSNPFTVAVRAPAPPSAPVIR